MNKKHFQSKIILLVILFLVSITLVLFVKKYLPKRTETRSRAQESISSPDPAFTEFKNAFDEVPFIGSIQTADMSREMLVQTALPELGEQKYLLQSGDPEAKLDILVIPGNFASLSDFETALQIVMYTGYGEALGLLASEPFVRFQIKINVSYTTVNLDEVYFRCTNQSGLIQSCRDDLIINTYASFKPDYILLLYNEAGGKKFQSAAGQIAHSNYLNDPLLMAKNIYTARHEFSHLFGLADEYADMISFSRSVPYICEDALCFERYFSTLDEIVNVDRPTCPKWCQGINQSLINSQNTACSAQTTKVSCTPGPMDPLPSGLSYYGQCRWFDSVTPLYGSQCIIGSEEFQTTSVGVNCQLGTGCFQGARYTPLAAKASAHSLMRDLVEGYSVPAQKHLEQVFECCYPQSTTASCVDFLQKMQQTSGGFRNEYHKIGWCGQIVPSPTPAPMPLSTIDSEWISATQLKITVHFNYLLAKATDWIAVYRIHQAPDISDQNYFDWKWLNDTQIQPATPVVNGTTTFTFNPYTDGVLDQFIVRYFTADPLQNWPWKRIQTMEVPFPGASVSPSPKVTITDLLTLINNYLGTNDSLYQPRDNKINFLDASFIISNISH